MKIQDQEGNFETDLEKNPYGEMDIQNTPQSELKQRSNKKDSNVLQSAQTLIIDEIAAM